MLLQNKTVAIVGGGPGGLVLARLLQGKGINVKVYERDPGREARPQGATLDLHKESGLRALEAAGLLDAFMQHYRPGADKLRITDKHLRILMDDHEEPGTGNFGQEHFRPEIDRGPLRDMLVDALAANNVVWQSQCISMQPEKDGWQLRFAGGATAYADLVVAADGANSGLRSYLTDIKPVYSGITIVEGNVYSAAMQAPELWALTAGGKVFALSDSVSLILSAKGDGSLSFYTGTPEKEDWALNCGLDFSDGQQLYGWFRQRFPGWSPVWQELFTGEGRYFIPRPMYHFPTDQCWETRPNLTILGDAAHRMPPYAGEGVNMAMLDALELSQALTSTLHNHIYSALAAYEHSMRTRAAEVTRETLAQTARLHSKEGLPHLLRLFGSDSGGAPILL